MDICGIGVEFLSRHEFDDDELCVLQNNWPKINFLKIPISWIYLIDTMLLDMGNDSSIIEIRQEFGQFIVLHGILSDRQSKILHRTEKLIYNLDIDLNSLLSSKGDLS
jgi:hypothetical protein